MSLNINKQEGEQLSPSEINDIVAANNSNDVETSTPSYSLFDSDFILNGTSIEDGIEKPLIALTPNADTTFFYGTQFIGTGSSTDPYRINPNLLPGGQPGVAVEQLITGCNYNNSQYSLQDPTFENVSFFSKRRVFITSKDFRFEWANNSNSVTTVYRDRVGLNNVTIKASVKHNGITYPITFNGERVKTLLPGDIIKSDIIGFEAQANDELLIITYVNVPSGGEIPVNRSAQDNTGEGIGDYPRNVDYTDGGTPGQIRGSLMFDCTGIYATPTYRNTSVVLLVGDSIMAGAGSNDPIRNHFVRALIDLNIPYFNMGIRGDQAQYFNSSVYSSERRKHITIGKFTHTFTNYGTNDIQNGGNPGADTIVSLQTLHPLLKTLVGSTTGLYQTTLFPKTNSSNQWVDIIGQTFIRESPRVEVNTFIRQALSPLTGIVDVTTFVEVNNSNILTMNGGYWITNGTANYPTADGIHLSDTLYQYVANNIKSQLSNILI